MLTSFKLPNLEAVGIVADLVSDSQRLKQLILQKLAI